MFRRLAGRTAAVPSLDLTVGMLTEEDRARLVEQIQRATADRTWEDRLRIAEAWDFMASEVRRLASLSGPQSGPLASRPDRQLLLDLLGW